MRFLLLSVVLVLSPLASAQSGGSDLAAAIATANVQFGERFAAQDAAAMADLYTEDGQLLPTGSDVVTGHEAIQAFWQGAFDAGLAGATLTTVEVEGDGDTAYEVGRYRLTTADGAVADEGKYVVFWRRDGDRWRLHRDIFNTSVAPPSEATAAPGDAAASMHAPDDLEWAEIVPGLEFGGVYGDWQAEAHAKLIRFAGDLVSPMHTHTHPYHGVVVQGLVINPYDDEGDPEVMGPGTHFYVPGGTPHRTGCVSAEPCLFYTHADEGWDIEMTEGFPPEPPYEVEADADRMTVERTRAIMEAYAASHDPQYLAEDAVFIDTATGQRHEGREAIGEMLNHIYHVAFDARAEDPRLIVGEGTAALEATFVGTHTGEFAGIAATGREVRVPLSVLYEVGPEGITEGRIYMQAAVMMQQLGAMAAAEH